MARYDIEFLLRRREPVNAIVLGNDAKVGPQRWLVLMVLLDLIIDRLTIHALTFKRTQLISPSQDTKWLDSCHSGRTRC